MSLKNERNLSAFSNTGVESAPSPAGLVTLTAATFYFEIPLTADGSLQSIHILTGAAIAGVFTIETSNLPQGSPVATTALGAVPTWDETVGNWVQENPSSAYVATNGTGWSVSALTLTKAAGAGGAMIHLGNIGARRCRVKAAITTGGTVRIVPHGKN
jgi:hypothetical protein